MCKMKQLIVVFLLCYVFMCGVCDNSWKERVLLDGHMLGLGLTKPGNYNLASLYKIELDGTVTQMWNASYDKSHNPFGEDTNLFAIDIENELVYLGLVDLFLAFDLKTGEVKIKIPLEAPNLQYFWNYDYVASNKSVCGVCTGHEKWDFWQWCCIKPTGSNSAQLDFLYHWPITSEWSPTDDIYYVDNLEQTVWYYAGWARNDFAIGVNYTTGKVVFTSGTYQGEDFCIVHDRVANRTFTIVWNSTTFTTVGLGELFPEPHTQKLLMKLPGNLVPSSFGMCIIDPITHTMVGLMTDQSATGKSAILLVDTVRLTYKVIPSDGGWGVTSVRYIPHAP